MPNIIDRCDSLGAKIASLKKIVRSDTAKKAPKLNLEEKIEEEVQKQRDKLPKKSDGLPNELAIDLPKAVKKAKKRKDSHPDTSFKPTALCDRFLKSIEVKKDSSKNNKKSP